MEVLMSSKIVDIGEICLPHTRLRPINDDKVNSIAESMKQFGQLYPIIIDDTYTLIAGLHRYKACLKNDNRNILCKIVKCTPEEAVIIEIDENLKRSDLTQDEKDSMMALRVKTLAKSKQLKEAKTPRVAFGEAVKETSRDTGETKRAIQKSLQIDKIPEDVKQQPFYRDLNKNEKLQLASNLVKEEKKSRVDETQTDDYIQRAINKTLTAKYENKKSITITLTGILAESVQDMAHRRRVEPELIVKELLNRALKGVNA